MPKSTATMSPFGVDEQVSLMHVGVEEAVAERVAEERLDEARGEQLPVMAGGGDRVEIGELDPVDPFERQDVPGGEIPFDLRNAKAAVAGGGLGHFRQGRGFQAEVHLDRHRAGEGVDDGDGLQTVGGGVGALDQPGGGIEGLEVAPEAAADVGPQDLDGDGAALAVGTGDLGAMDLGDGGGGDRRRERCEQFIDRLAERGRDHGAGLGIRKRRDLVAEPAEDAGGLAADDVGARREKLAELDVGGTEPVEGNRQPRDAGLRAVAVPPLEQPREAKDVPRSRRQLAEVDDGEGPFAGEHEAGAGHPEKGDEGPGHRD